MSFEPHENETVTAAADAVGVDAAAGGDIADFSFGDQTLSEDDVVELELFHPEGDFEDLPRGRGVVPATIATVVLHVWLLATIDSIIRFEPSVIAAAPAQASIEPAQKEPDKKLEPDPKPKYTLANPDDRELEVRKVLNATSTGISHSKKPQILSPPDPPLDEIDPTRKRDEVFDIPEGLILSQTLVVKGTTGNAMVQIESALDRVTHEIATNLKEKKVLLIWLVDASTSLQKEREIVAKRLRRIYGELDALGKAGEIPRVRQPLLTGVVSYGARHEILTPHPTARVSDIQDAFKNVKEIAKNRSEEGVENVFTAIHKTLNLWSSYRVGRQVMIVTITDESGDDFGMLEPTIALCRRFGAKAYVIGPPAAFGRRKGYVPYVAPENGKTYGIPIDIGPETARYENVLLPFWFEGPQFDYLSSGYGPYALSRLVKETGGIYFTTRTFTTKGMKIVGDYNDEALKPFQPNYSFGSPAEYDKDLAKHPLRYATVAAAALSRMNKPEGTPRLDIRVTPGNYRQTATTAQQTVAKSQLMVDNILKAFPRGIERALDQEKSARWRMTFCLTYGRLLASRVRCLEYNSACADLKGSLTPEDVRSKANHWIFRPDKDINYATSERRNAKLAKKLLQRVMKEAPGTPWAVLAERELKHPFGIRVVKRFIAPPTPRPRAKTNATPRRRILLAREQRKRQANRKPAPKPKPPKLPRY